MYRFHSSIVECPHSIMGGPGSIPRRCSSIFGIWREVLGRKHTHIMYRFHSSMVEHPHFIRGGTGSFPGRCSSIFGIWREVLGRNVYIMSQYFFPAIIYRDIISHITITYRYIMYFFRTFKKSAVAKALDRIYSYLLLRTVGFCTIIEGRTGYTKLIVLITF
jgi:hypothetical protein